MKRPKIFCFWKMEVKRLLVASILLSLVSVISGFSTAQVFATNATLQISIASGDLEFTVAPGVFNSGSKAVTVTTDNYTGYTMALSTADNTTDLIHTVDNTATIPTLTLPSGSNSITSAQFTGTEYGYSLNGTDFMPIVDNANIRTGTSGTANFDFTIGAIVETNTLAGDYEQTITLALVANAPVVSISYDEGTNDTVTNMPAQDEFTMSGSQITVSDKTPVRSGYDFLGWEYVTDTTLGTTAVVQPSGIIEVDPTVANNKTLTALWMRHCEGICYDGNGATAGTMDTQTIPANGTTVMLWAPNFSKTGYGFAGWNTEPDGSGTTYGPNETIAKPTYGKIWLYAMWVAPEQGLTMQTFDKDAAPYAAASTGTVIALEDERDGNVYAITKLADGNWWMTENLRLNPQDTNTTITPANTNNPNLSFVTDIASNYKGNSQAMIWKTCQNSTPACVDQISFGVGNINRNNTASPSSSGQNSQWYAYGVVYNWYTATAGNGTYALTNTTVSGDICPASWHLPTGTGSGEMGLLSNALGGYQENGVAQDMGSSTTPTGGEMSAVFRSTPNNVVYSGQYNASSASSRNSNGNYWLATAGSNTGFATYLGIVNHLAKPGTSAGSATYFGYPVRCIASVRPSSYTLNYDANSGEGAPASQTESSSVITISSTAPTRTNYDFLGWSTMPNATEPDYQPDDQITVANATTTLYAVWERTCNGICYDNNGGTGSTNPQSAAANASVMLWTTKFARSGYGFAGWNTKADGTGTNYGLNETITMPASGKLWLYAHWIPAEQNVTLQTFDQTDSAYASAAVGTMIALEDERDGNVYTVVKHEDGNWWMMENLRLNLASNSTTITNLNTNNPTDAFVTAASAHPLSSVAWCTTNDSSCDDQIFHNTNNITNADGSARNQYSVYYNWYTATAGQGTYDFTSGDVPGDICPAGWHLPTGGANGEYYNLSYAANNNSNVTNNSLALRAYPYNFVYGGIDTGSALAGRGTYGHHWSSTASGNNNAYYLGINNSYTRPGTSSATKYNGYSVRCLANTAKTFTLTYDANGGSNAPAAETGSSVNLYTFTVTDAEPTHSTASFVGWSFDANATTPDYVADDEVSTTNPNITLYAIWDRLCEGICYDGNGATAGTMDEQTATGGSEVTLDASNFSRPGFGFAGWNTRADGAGTLYGPNETITMPASGTLWLYATWVASAGNLQNFSCSSLAAGATTALTDTRDGQTYAISKLVDGKCWMVENLRLDLSDTNITISAANTNNPTAAFISAANSHPASSSTWCVDDNSTCVDQITYNTSNMTRASTDARYLYGGYYNWYTATAGNGTYATTSGNAAGDICPAGWHLPSGTGSGEFGKLSNALGGYQDNNGMAQSMDGSTTPTGANISKTFRATNNNFVYSGGYTGSSANNPGGIGRNWTTSASSNYYASSMTIHSTYVHPGTVNGSKDFGRTVRCVANYYTITYDAGDGNIDGESTVDVLIDRGQALGNTIPQPKRFNYIFTGWVDSNNNPVDASTVPTGDTEYTATWRATTFPTIWHQDGSCFFGGANGTITGADCATYAGRKYIDTGVQLYTTTNISKDYEIGFTIRHYVASEQDAGGQETFMNTKREGGNYPGLVFRRASDKLEIASRRTSNANSTTTFESSTTPFENLKIRIVRRMKANNVQSIYYSVNDGPLTELNNLGSYNPTFDLSVWFGATPTDDTATAARRFVKAEVSDMYIRLGTYEEY